MMPLTVNFNPADFGRVALPAPGRVPAPGVCLRSSFPAPWIVSACGRIPAQHTRVVADVTCAACLDKVRR